jgi:hypothetical protein
MLNLYLFFFGGETVGLIGVLLFTGCLWLYRQLRPGRSLKVLVPKSMEAREQTKFSSSDVETMLRMTRNFVEEAIQSGLRKDEAVKLSVQVLDCLDCMKLAIEDEREAAVEVALDAERILEEVNA